MKDTGEENVYIILHKPIGYITHDLNDETTSILQLLTPSNYLGQDPIKLFSQVSCINNLEINSEGLVLLTNDLSIEKDVTIRDIEYEITIDSTLTRDAKNLLTKGMIIDGVYRTGIEILKEFNKGKRTIITAVLSEDQTHIRKMFTVLGYHVSSIKCIKIAKLQLGILPVGKWKSVCREKII